MGVGLFFQCAFGSDAGYFVECGIGCFLAGFVFEAGAEAVEEGRTGFCPGGGDGGVRGVQEAQVATGGGLAGAAAEDEEPGERFVEELFAGEAGVESNVGNDFKESESSSTSIAFTGAISVE